MTLDEHLADCYGGQVGIPRKTGLPQFIAAMKRDDKLLADAVRRHAGLVDDVTQKCFISKTHRAILDYALNSIGVADGK